jgi:hypothetical protein
MQENLTGAPAHHALSLGGGVNSVALLVWLLEKGKPLDEVVFADTGAEVPETYQYLPVVREVLRPRPIPLTVLQKAEGRDLYATAWRRRVIPSAVWRWSTRDFKVGPIQRHYRRLGRPIVQYLGIAFDELERMKPSRVSYVRNEFPLVDERITREGCEEIIRRAGLPMPVKSGCFFCPFNSLDRWRWLHVEHPDLFDRSVDLEENSKHFPTQRLTDQIFRNRGKITLREMRKAFASGQPVAAPQTIESPCGGECMT